MGLRPIHSRYLGRRPSGGLRFLTAPSSAPVAHVPLGGTFDNEGDDALWTVVGGGGSNTITRETTPTPSGGTHYGRVNFGSAITTNIDSSAVVVVAGNTVTATAAVRWITGATPRNMRLDLRFFSDTAATVVVSTSAGTSTATSAAAWSTLTRAGVAVPATAIRARVRVVTLTPQAAEASGVDQVTLVV